MIHFYINFHNMTATGTHTLQTQNDRLKKKYYLHKYLIVFLSIVYDCVMYLPILISKQLWKIVSIHPNLELSFLILIINRLTI